MFARDYNEEERVLAVSPLGPLPGVLFHREMMIPQSLILILHLILLKIDFHFVYTCTYVYMYVCMFT